MDLDFNNIRTHKGSKDNGFEELVCQLARLHRPENARDFIRKEGSGGDAGVECFWKLNDDSEYGWQAKYFLKEVKWGQISESVETALKNHPKLKKYYICLPLDRTDQRQKKKKSQLDKWNEKVKEWEEVADSENMKVKFEFWGASEIVSMLSTDDPHFSGRALYWFKEPILQIQQFKDIAKNSEQSLGDRFSPELNVDLPIGKSFDGVGLTPNWYKRFYSVAENWLKKLQDLKSIINKTDNQLKKKRWDPIKEYIFNLELVLNKTIKANSLYENKEKIKETIQDLEQNIRKENNSDRTIQRYQFNNATYELLNFLFSEDMEAFSTKSMLLSGDAGMGKSHLLCDITLNRLEENLPTLFLLGQHYEGGNPLKFISDSLDLNNNRYKIVLGALDALGEAYSTRTLIIIDAINEGSKKEDWKDQIVKLIHELAKYPNIGFVFSCRSTYIQYLLPQFGSSGKNQSKAKLPVEIKHTGFSDPSHHIIHEYLKKQNILIPDISLMKSEFSNPLLLKIYCKIIRTIGKGKLPEGVEGTRKIFECYINAVSKTINGKKKYRPNEKIILEALRAFALRLFPDNLHGLSLNETRDTIKSIDPKPETGDLLNELINEGILSEDIYRQRPIVRFTYERFSDYFISENLIVEDTRKNNKYITFFRNLLNCFFYKIILKKKYSFHLEKLKPYFKKEIKIETIFLDNHIYKFGGIIEALFVCLAERFKLELFDYLIDVEEKKKQWLLQEPFFNSILWRSSKSFTEKTFKLLGQIQRDDLTSPKVDILLNLSIIPEHPWNAYFLDRQLKKKELHERDHFWSIYVALSDKMSSLIKIIDWSLNKNLDDVSKKRLELTAIVLLWTTTCTNRKTRNDATIGLARVFAHIPEKIPKFLKEYNNVNDPYLVERLYAAVYGAVLVQKENKFVKKIADIVYQTVFKNNKPYPHILIRDYARGILEYANYKKLLDESINLSIFRPPYQSDWPIKDPSQEEINKLEDYNFPSKIKDSVMGFLGDFGKYTMSCVHNWSSIPLTEKLKTGIDIHTEFANNLPDEALRNRYLDCISKTVSGSQNPSEWKEELDKRSSLENYNSIRESQEKLFKDVNITLNEVSKEHFKRLSEIPIDNKPLTFNKELAQRWVLKKAYELGWSKELFREFEEQIPCINDIIRDQTKTERIGKKYQWIAFHELLARMSDNLHWIDENYPDKDSSKFYGPWQISKRDLDPTFWKLKHKDSNNICNTPWWKPYNPPFSQGNLDAKKEWLKDTIPPFSDLVRVSSKDNKKMDRFTRFCIMEER